MPERLCTTVKNDATGRSYCHGCGPANKAPCSNLDFLFVCMVNLTRKPSMLRMRTNGCLIISIYLISKANVADWWQISA